MPLTRLRDALRLATACGIAGALGWAWELLARQAPSSPWHMRGFPSAIERFATHAWIVGAVAFALAPSAFRALEKSPTRARRVLLAAHAGALLVLAALAYSAATGQFGMQIRDGDALSHALLASRTLGDALLAYAFIESSRAAITSATSP